jgi:iron complex transport system substrate-binding protein
VIFLLAHAGRNTMMVAGEQTAAHAAIRLAGGRNALAGFKGYKPLTAEAVIGADPVVLLISREGLEALGGEQAVWSLPGLALTSAGRSKRLVAMDALYLLGFGPRLPEAVRDLAVKLRAQ